MTIPRIGIASRASLRGGVGEAMDRFRSCTGTFPDIVPIWWRLWDDHPRWSQIRESIVEARDRGIEPMLYYETGPTRRFTSGDMEPELAWESDGHPAILRGELDELIASMVRDLGPIDVRIDQEANGKVGGHGAGMWRTVSAWEYRNAFTYIQDVMHAANPDVSTIYSPVWRGKDNVQGFLDHLPPTADKVGFTRYSRAPITRRRLRDLAQQAKAPVATLRSVTDRRIVWTETGRRRGAGARGRWLRGLRDVEGVESVVIMDWDLTATEPDNDWSLTRKQRRILGNIIREGRG